MKGPRKFLTSAEVTRCRDAIGHAVSKRLGEWDAHGWAFVGRTPRIRVAVKVTRKRVLTPTPAITVPLPRSIGGGALKVAVAASYRDHLPPSTRATAATAGQRVSQPLAPGSPILVGQAGALEQAGIAALCVVNDELHLLTCGHAFSAGDEVFVDENDPPVATLVKSYMAGSSDRLDAAIAKLTDDGKDQLRQSFGAPTWFSDVHDPAPGDNDRPCEFWPTHFGNSGPFEENVASFSACDTVLFGLRGPSCGFIEVPFRAIGGDSGSVLAKDGSFYGLCSGTVGTASFFTPIATVIDRLRRDFPAEVSLWSPSANPPGLL